MAKRHSFARTQALVNQNPNVNLKRKTTVSGTSLAATITGNTILTAAQSGELILIDGSGMTTELEITLPPPSVGLNYKLVLAKDTSDNIITIHCDSDSDDERIVGVTTCGSDPQGYLYEYAVDSMSISVDASGYGASKGTIIEIVYAGAGNWLITQAMSDMYIEESG
jgi:hypothetical protein